MINYEYYRDLPMKEYEGVLANRDYWDHCSCEWERRPMENKLIALGIFARRGGKLSRVINRYAEGREYTYRHAIQYCMMDYLERLFGTHDYYVRIMLLDKRELLWLLTELLKVAVISDYVRDYRTGQYRDTWSVIKDTKRSESILLAIEERHKRIYPDETLEHQRKLVKRWMEGSLW